MTDNPATENRFDNPNGRLLVATCSKPQLDAIQNLMIASFDAGFRSGWDKAFESMEKVLESVEAEKSEPQG